MLIEAPGEHRWGEKDFNLFLIRFTLCSSSAKFPSLSLVCISSFSNFKAKSQIDLPGNYSGAPSMIPSPVFCFVLFF